MLGVWMSTGTLSPLDSAMARFAEGDDAALGDVYDLGSPAVFTFLLRTCRDRQLAEDLTQETFLRIHRARGLYRIGAPVLPWAYTIARRLFLDAARARRFESSALAPVDGDRDRGRDGDGRGRSIEDVPASGPSAEDLVSDEQLAHSVEAALARIPESQATAFRLLKGEGLSVAQVAAVTGTTRGAVKLRAHRAYQALRGLLGAQLAGSGGAGEGEP
jgi:RNA polymerase sigma-70 factor (ECF subfamily)